eukprot:GHVS01019515.1.p1 GENE.GHVS01019515.1~~GHVS01019515.1.p1  ORF type:complete len:182 (-),score=80.80 GHVS01019515.1:150-695(-)
MSPSDTTATDGMNRKNSRIAALQAQLGGATANYGKVPPAALLHRVCTQKEEVEMPAESTPGYGCLAEVTRLNSNSAHIHCSTSSSGSSSSSCRSGSSSSSKASGSCGSGSSKASSICGSGSSNASSSCGSGSSNASSICGSGSSSCSSALKVASTAGAAVVAADKLKLSGGDEKETESRGR